MDKRGWVALLLVFVTASIVSIAFMIAERQVSPLMLIALFFSLWATVIHVRFRRVYFSPKDPMPLPDILNLFITMGVSPLDTCSALNIVARYQGRARRTMLSYTDIPYKLARKLRTLTLDTCRLTARSEEELGQFVWQLTVGSGTPLYGARYESVGEAGERQWKDNHFSPVVHTKGSVYKVVEP